MPLLLLQVALIIIIVRSIYVLVQIHLPRKKWLDVLFHGSVAVVALHFLL
ncbi:MAG: hypothetical protein JWR03_2859 [Cohnella sp.]|jgi:steroid 5-alpha reductase family enzyme|nr:hypothetical protein [Cohnella sp.]